jgi:integrase
MYGSHTRTINETFGDRDPHTITASEIAEWVAERAETRKPGTLKQYINVFRSLLDHAGVDPNPARDPRVKLPKQVRDEVNPPPADHFLAILGELLPRWRLFFITLEQGALRIGEAVNLRWADVDAAGLRLRLPKSATKTDKARWVYLPEWLIQATRRPARLKIVFLSAGCSRGSSSRLPDRR